MSNPFIKSANEAKVRGDRSVAHRLTVEGRIVSKLIKHGLASGYAVSVCDGEEWVVKQSTDYAKLIAACASTDEDRIRFWSLGADDHHKIGTVTLIYGNCGYDVISDYSSDDLDAFSAWIKPVEDYAETFDV